MKVLGIFAIETIVVGLFVAAVAVLPAAGQTQPGTIKLPTQTQVINCVNTLGVNGTATNVCVRPSNGLTQPVGDFLRPDGKPINPVQ